MDLERSGPRHHVVARHQQAIAMHHECGAGSVILVRSLTSTASAKFGQVGQLVFDNADLAAGRFGVAFGLRFESVAVLLASFPAVVKLSLGFDRLELANLI